MDKYKIAILRRDIKRMQYLLTHSTGAKHLLLRFRIKICMINLRHELRQLK